MHMDDAPFPPYYYVMQVLDYMPAAASTYFMLWKDYFDLPANQTRVTYDKKAIENDRFMKWNKFNNDLNILGKFGLLERMKLDDNRVVVELAAWNDE